MENSVMNIKLNEYVAYEKCLARCKPLMEYPFIVSMSLTHSFHFKLGHFPPYMQPLKTEYNKKRSCS